MHVLRAEKGYVIVGQDTDGTVTPHDLGLGWMVSKTKGDFVGRRSHRRPDALRADRKQLVGLLPHDPDERLPEGAQLVEDREAPVPVPMLGHVTSSYRSAALGRTFALALVKGGRARHGGDAVRAAGRRTRRRSRSPSPCSSTRRGRAAMAERRSASSRALTPPGVRARAAVLRAGRPARGADSVAAAGAALGVALPVEPNTVGVGGGRSGAVARPRRVARGRPRR